MRLGVRKMLRGLRSACWGVLVVVPGKERLLGRLVVEGQEQGSAAWREEKGLKGLLGT